MDYIVLKNMAFYANHGHLPEETALGQRFFLDVKVAADLSKAGQSDALEDSINYVAIYEVVSQIVQEVPCHLLERVTSKIADVLWSDLSNRVEGVQVTMRKPSVPIAGILDYAEVTIGRGCF